MFANTQAECNPEAARRQLGELERYVAGAARDGAAAHTVERHLFREVLALGARLFGWFLERVGPGDPGERVELGDGRAVNRLPGHPPRRVVTVFGAFSLPRCVYAARAGQKVELAPTDQRLQLPEGDVSYLLREWDQMPGVGHAFAAVGKTLGAIPGLKQSVDTLERGSRHMAGAAEPFRAAQPAPDPEKEGERERSWSRPRTTRGCRWSGPHKALKAPRPGRTGGRGRRRIRSRWRASGASTRCRRTPARPRN